MGMSLPRALPAAAAAQELYEEDLVCGVANRIDPQKEDEVWAYLDEPMRS
jgi:hypothetical protein